MTEWQTETDSNGVMRRYRMVGHIKEYEQMITVSGGIEIPESMLEDYRQREEERRQAQIKADQERAKKAAIASSKICPFKCLTGGVSRCSGEDCALYNGKCSLAINKTPAKSTIGIRCPLTHRSCASDCVLFNKNGCVLTAINTEREDITE